MTHLQVENISCCRGTKTLFSDISFSISQGEALQLIGHNGSGKTSLLRILATLSKAETGEIFWHGDNIKQNNETYVNNLCYLGHRLGLNSNLTVTQNLRFHQAIKGGIKEDRLQSALTLLSIEKYSHYPCGHLSSGIQKRVALARLVLSDTPLWIIDEPINALDKTSITLLEQLLCDKLSFGGMVIFSSHLPLNIQGHHAQTITIGDQ